MLTTINEFRTYLKESISHTTAHEKWGDNYKIIYRNEDSPNQKLIAVLDYHINEQEYYIESIAVLPFYRRMGYAKLLFNDLIQKAKENNIHTIRLHAFSLDKKRISTEKLVEMYQKWGFQIVPQTIYKNKVEMIYKL